MEKKVKHILVILIIVILAIVGITIIYKIKSKNTEINETEAIEIEDEKIKLEQFEDSHILILDLVRKNGDWSKLPVTQKFRDKYNERDGILGDKQFDKVEYRPYRDGEYYFTEAPYFVITQGKVQTAYIFNWDTSLEGIDDIILGYIVQLTDENGNKLDSRQPITNENFNSLMYDIAFGPPDDEGVGVTDHFHKKYPYFLDLFIHYSPLGCNKITFQEDLSSYEKKEGYFEVDSIYETKKRNYKVTFSLDEKNYLDDAEVTLLSESEYERNTKVEAGSQVIYQNSNWDILKLTDNFRTKYNSRYGVFKDIESINVNDVSGDMVKYKGNYIEPYHYKDGSVRWHYTKYIYDDGGYLDDVEIIPIDYNGTNAEEALEKYKEQYNISD